ncbi:MAG TPA: hypothetical protein VK731_05680 [Candidatus Cybelea sp.]|jgi:hypothetical protein|nr:hypothetical protein [Candidatus Cybelea sp.]
MSNTIEFTPREKMLINYYCDRQLSGGRRGLASQILFTVVPLICAALFFWHGETAWIFVGYALLLYRVGQTLWSGIVYNNSFSSIFEKYEARIKELEAAKEESK